MCGYALPSVLLYFGTMVILAILLQSLFVENRSSVSPQETVPNTPSSGCFPERQLPSPHPLAFTR
jgi:hypothetical protein